MHRLKQQSPLLVIFFTIALDMIVFGMVVPLLPYYAAQYAVTATNIGWLFACYSLAQFIFAPLWGRLSDRIGRRPVLLTSIAANILALIIFAFAQNYWMLFVARLLAGICAANIAVANAYVADVTDPQNRARGMGIVGAAFGIGFVVGPFFGGELSVLNPMLPALVAALLSSINFCAAWFFLPESLTIKQQTISVYGLQERLMLLRKHRVLRLPLVLVFLQVFSFSMLEMALVLFVARRLGLNAQHCGRVFAYIGVVLALVQGACVGRLARRFSETYLVCAGLLLVSLGMLLVPTTPMYDTPYFLVAMTLVGCGQALTSPSLSSMLSKLATRFSYGQGAVSGLSQSLSSLARALGPQLAGFGLDLYGENWPFWASACITSIAFISTCTLLRPKIVEMSH